MTTHVDRKLEELGLSLPEAAAPVAAYVPVVEAGGLLHLSGQLPFSAGQLVTGRLGDGVSLEDGQEAAKLCGLMIVAQVKKYLGGDLSRVKRIVKLGVFVNSAADFTDQPKVANGASELMVALFGDAGKHARSAVPVLPLGAAVEVDAIVELAGRGWGIVSHAPSASRCRAPISPAMTITTFAA
jgi:enamine deaminase RidA (YjgF/YER057c/UK114 family)